MNRPADETEPPLIAPGERAAPRSLHLKLPDSLMVLARLGIVAIVVTALYVGKDILVPLALAALLAFLLDPLVTRLRRLQVPRGLAVCIVTLSTLAVMAGAAVLVGQQVVQVGKDLPQYQNTIESKLRALRQRIAGDRSLHSASRLIDSVGSEVTATRKALEDSAKGAQPRAPRPVPVQVAPAEVSSLKALHDAVSPVLEPLFTGGIAVVLLIFMLLQRNELRDRLMRLVGGDLHHMTDALDEAAHRVSRYLTMQVIVNTSYGVPLTLGLWWIGIPGAMLWGLLAATLRFVPYLGPVVASVLPLAMAFAVDPGWDLLLWTLALVLTLELICNNLVEPWLYGSSTGLAPVAILLSAAFWTVLWGTVGLILATPITVCLVVMGRHLPSMRFLDLLLGNSPVFDAPTRLYQRLLSGNVDEARDLAEAGIAESGLTAFYSRTAVPALSLAAADHARVARAEHRHRLATGMGQLLAELRDDHPAVATADTGRPAVSCVALRWEVDALAGAMLAHALAVEGVPAHHLPAGSMRAGRLSGLAPDGVVCLSSFHPDPEALARHACRRLRRLQPGVRIVLCLWRAPAALLEPGAAAALGALTVATSLQEALEHVRALQPATVGEPGQAQRVESARPVADADLLAVCRRIDSVRAAPARHMAQRAAEIFDMAHGVVCWIDDGEPGSQTDGHGRRVDLDALQQALIAPALAGDGAVVVPDAARDPRLMAAVEAGTLPHRFVAVVPLHWAPERVIGVLCLLDGAPRVFSAPDLRLLEAMSQDLVGQVRAAAEPLADPDPQVAEPIAGVTLLPRLAS